MPTPPAVTITPPTPERLAAQQELDIFSQRFEGAELQDIFAESPPDDGPEVLFSTEVRRSKYFYFSLNVFLYGSMYSIRMHFQY